MGARSCLLARAGDAGLRIGNDSLLAVHDVRSQQRSQSKNHRSGIAAGIGHQSRAGKPVAIQLGKPVHRFLHEFGRGDGILVMKVIDGAVLRLPQPPGAAQIHHAHAVGHRFRHQCARDFVRRGQKQQFDLAPFQFRPGPRLQRISAVAGNGGIHVGEIDLGHSLAGTLKHHRSFHAGMAQQNAGQFEAGISGRTQDRGFEFGRHQASIS